MHTFIFSFLPHFSVRQNHFQHNNSSNDDVWIDIPCDKRKERREEKRIRHTIVMSLGGFGSWRLCHSLYRARCRR